jgi:hypothetical protein
MQYVNNCVLSQSDESKLDSLLYNLTTTRSSIFESMVFCIKNSDCSTQILQSILTKSPNLAGLYLISDILYNCTKVDVQYSWSYLPQLESLLPSFLSHLKHSQPALKVLQIWRSWSLFDPLYTLGLESVINVKPLKPSEVLEVYNSLLQSSDEYFIKKLCKCFGQSATENLSTQINSILYFINYLLVTFSISDNWVQIDLLSSGEHPEKVIEKINKALNTLISPEIQGLPFDIPSQKVLKKLLSKFPNTYLCQHS